MTDIQNAPPGRPVSRRAFVKALAAAALSAGVGGCGGPVAPGGSPKRVVIIGAGLSGLVAGFELAALGHDVSIVEARERVGGRVLTLRDPFSDGQFAEAGAARIPPNHDLTLRYAALFGLQLDPFYAQSGGFVDLTGTTRRLVSPGEFLGSRPGYVKIRGGTDRLPRAFAEELGSRIRLSSPATLIEQGQAGVKVSGAGWILEADRVLCTAPLPVLGRISFEPVLSTAKQEAAAGGFSYMPSTRIFVQFAQRSWEGEGMNGWATTDWPEELWHPSWDLPGPRGLLLSYVRGERALALDALGDGAKLQTLLEHWDRVFPGVGKHALSHAVHSWQQDPWARRAWAAPSSSELIRYGTAIRQPEGRVHFAGEHASDDRGWMQGALASGLRAADEIHRSAS